MEDLRIYSFSYDLCIFIRDRYLVSCYVIFKGVFVQRNQLLSILSEGDLRVRTCSGIGYGDGEVDVGLSCRGPPGDGSEVGGLVSLFGGFGGWILVGVNVAATLGKYTMYVEGWWDLWRNGGRWTFRVCASMMPLVVRASITNDAT